MVVFHAARDLEFLQVLPPGTTLSGGWSIFARCVAGSFFFFAGISLVLAHAGGIRWLGFWHRLAMVGAAALLVSAVTYAAMPSRFIYFGILHSIAICSLIGLVFVPLPASVTLLAAAGVLGLHLGDVHPLSLPIWSPTGLSNIVRPTLDLLPIVPWLSPLLIGIFVAKVWQPVPGRSTTLLTWLGWPGRHSLWIYLLHQPILIGVMWLLLRWLS